MSNVRTERKNGGLPLWGFNQRYWVKTGGEDFLSRRTLVITPWFAVLDTDIFKPDADRDPHDHSRPFLSLILRGGYDEAVYNDPADLSDVTARRHRRWSLHFMPEDRAHNITAVHGRLRTFVLAGRSRGTWSFWTPEGKIDWREHDPVQEDTGYPACETAPNGTGARCTCAFACANYWLRAKGYKA